jgi:hypothetical protein
MENNIIKMFQSPETLDDWKAYIAEATAAENRANLTKVKAILEKGKRIIEFHNAFRTHKQKWGRRWDELCVEIIGISKASCDRYELVAKNIDHEVSYISFPGDIQALSYLARTKSTHPEVFNAAVVAGEITPKTNRDKAEIIMRRAEAKPSKGKPFRRIQRKEERKITIPYEDVVNKFRPLIKRVKEQSKRHAATVSFVELSVIAFELGKLADAWTENEPESGTPSEPVPFKRP